MSDHLPGIRRLSPHGLVSSTAAFSPGILVPLPGADLLLVSGQIAVNQEGAVVAPHDAKAQAEFVFARMGRVLQEAGLDFAHVIKAQIFLTNMQDLPVVSEVRNKYFATSRPVSTLLEVAKLVREGCCVEVEVMALRLHGAESTKPS